VFVEDMLEIAFVGQLLTEKNRGRPDNSKEGTLARGDGKTTSGRPLQKRFKQPWPDSKTERSIKEKY